MAGLGDNYQDIVLDILFGNSDPSPVATLYLALYTVTPTAAGGGTEVSGGAYARVAVANNNTNFPDASGGSQANGTAFTFPTATGDWGTVVAFAYHDDPTADSVVAFGAIGTPIDVPSAATAQFAPGALVATAA